MTPEERAVKLRDLAYRVETASVELKNIADGTLYDLNQTVWYLEEVMDELKAIR
jgi:hypothetical protein